MSRKFYQENNVAIPAIQFVNEQPIGYTLITDAAQIKKLYLLQYQLRIDAGQNFVLNFTADMYINVVNEVYTTEQVFQLENHLKYLYDELNNGWWLSAQNTNQNLSLLGIYTQTMKDEIQGIIDLYIFENY